MKTIFSLFFYLTISQLLFFASTHASSNDSVKENNKVVAEWNQFINNIYQLHLNTTRNRDIKTSKSSGSYYRLPDFYREVKYYDVNTNNLISRIERETDNPDNIHSIEVILRDDKDRVIREYSASFLPKYRNAPYQTLINLHNYNNSLHSYRQFDASDNLIYEVCTDTTTNKKIYEHDDYEIPDNLTSGIGSEKEYMKCFKQLPKTAGIYTNPH